MKRVMSKPPGAKMQRRNWRIALIRKRLDRLGRVVAADREAAAVAEFGLTDEQRKRLLIEEVR
jgi:hypothetical protein